MLKTWRSISNGTSFDFINIILAKNNIVILLTMIMLMNIKLKVKKNTLRVVFLYEFRHIWLYLLVCFLFVTFIYFFQQDFQQDCHSASNNKAIPLICVHLFLQWAQFFICFVRFI